ncbi:mltn-9 [Pristionchus pacificus]|uniref:Mltn-9 n=1 Tax=Pristionchus pacificus TaxID=54126 RepID=A0A2A6C3Y7_PRIPA|nr:mltn-9 [Pristionchus pacificus]|eukprot:PDM72839.1 mltn-9 [Pristionchus pacificus]
MLLHLIVLLPFISHLVCADIRNGQPNLRTNGQIVVDKMRMGKDSFEAVRDMHYMWYVHSVKALLVQVAKGVVPQLDKDSERDFLLCLHRIPMKTDIVRTSECLIRARAAINDHRRSTHTSTQHERTFIIEKSVERERPREIQSRPTKKPVITAQIRAKNRKIDERKLLLRKKISAKNDVVIRKKADHRRVKRSEYRLVERPGTKSDKRNFVKKLARMPNLHSAEKTPIQRITQAISKIVRSTSETDDKESGWSETYKNILKLKKQMDGQHKSVGARVYDLPMEELVFNKKLNDSSSSPMRSVNMPPLVEQAFSLADSIRSHSSKIKADPNYKMLSPRFAPVLPDKYEGRGLLSPSILSFYKASHDDSEDQIVPLPSLLEATGMQKKDRDSLLEMIMEVSGARRTVDEAMQTLKKMNLFGVEGAFLEATKKIQESFKDIEKSFTRRQKYQMKKRQFTFLDKNQLVEVHSKQGMKDGQMLDFNLDEYSSLSHKQREVALWKRIETFAANKTEESIHGRTKRQSVLNPTVLSPYMFSPVYGLTILGPVVLSPSLFSPLILNPAVLSPYVLSPAVGMPFILSPYVLSPYVLSPLIMAPFILTPYVLSPNVINPYVLSPLILSPLVLCPDVLSPMFLGGAILSPAVGSPALFSKSTLMASVLSPSVLS